jgi:hypothetical protein
LYNHAAIEVLYIFSIDARFPAKFGRKTFSRLQTQPLFYRKYVKNRIKMSINIKRFVKSGAIRFAKWYGKHAKLIVRPSISAVCVKYP